MAELKHLEWFSYLDEPPYLYGLEHSEGVARPIIRVMIQINTEICVTDWLSSVTRFAKTRLQ